MTCWRLQKCIFDPFKAPMHCNCYAAGMLVKWPKINGWGMSFSVLQCCITSSVAVLVKCHPGSSTQWSNEMTSFLSIAGWQCPSISLKSTLLWLSDEVMSERLVTFDRHESTLEFRTMGPCLCAQCWLSHNNILLRQPPLRCHFGLWWPPGQFPGHTHLNHHATLTLAKHQQCTAISQDAYLPCCKTHDFTSHQWKSTSTYPANYQNAK